MPSAQSLNDALLRCYAAGKLPEALALIPQAIRLRTLQDWRNWTHPHQREPEGSDWRLWLVLGGRGSGKSRTGAEWIRLRVRYSNHPLRVALVAPSLLEARSVMVEGESGLLAVHPSSDRPRYLPSRREIVFANGSIAQLYSAEAPDLLRGPQFHLAWCDELAKWRYLEKTWNMLQFALRLGERPQQVVTTTPRPLALLKAMIADPQTVLSSAPTIANAGYLAPSLLRELHRLYGGTTLGRQELDGELIDDDPDALFQRSLFDRFRRSHAPPLARIVVAVDPPVSSTARSDACGIVCVGLGEDDRAYVLDDMTTQGLSPSNWAMRVIALFHAREADLIVAEVNQGGNLVAEILRGIDPAVPVRTVTASRGKYIRAEPVAALYEQGRVSHVGMFAALEDEMCAFTSVRSTRSPDRLDALVWALTELVLRRTHRPRIRTV